MAYFNSRTLGFYPGVDDGDKEDVNIPDEEVLDPYEWDDYDDDPYEDIRPHLKSDSPMSEEPGQDQHRISDSPDPPVVTSTLAGEKTEMEEPPDMCQEPEVMEEGKTMESLQPIHDPELEAIESQVKVMEEENKKVQKEEDMQPTISTCGAQLNMGLEEKMDVDSRSVYIGNVDCSTTTEAERDGNIAKSIQEKVEQPLPVEVYDINQCQVLCTFDLGSLQLEQSVPGEKSEKTSEEDPKKLPKEDPKKDSKKAAIEADDAKENPKKESKKTITTANEAEAVKKDPKKDSRLAEVVPVNDARPEETIIDCENLLDEFEASLSASNRCDVNQEPRTLETKFFDLITLCGHPLAIFKYDLDSLQGTSYVTEGAVEFFLDVMYQEIDVKARKDVHILSTAVFSTLKSRFEKGNERSLQLTTNIFDKNYIIIPICHNSHWIIAVATRLSRYLN